MKAANPTKLTGKNTFLQSQGIDENIRPSIATIQSRKRATAIQLCNSNGHEFSVDCDEKGRTVLQLSVSCRTFFSKSRVSYSNRRADLEFLIVSEREHGKIKDDSCILPENEGIMRRILYGYVLYFWFVFSVLSPWSSVVSIQISWRFLVATTFLRSYCPQLTCSHFNYIASSRGVSYNLFLFISSH